MTLNNPGPGTLPDPVQPDQKATFSRPPILLNLCVILLIYLLPTGNAFGESVMPTENETAIAIGHRDYEITLGVTSRAQALIVFDGRGDQRLAVMTGSFKPAPHLYVTTPFHMLGQDIVDGVPVSRHGYFWKYSYNRFSLDRQEDPDSGGIGPASPVYDYGTEVQGEFYAVAPVYALEMLRPDGTVPFRIEVGIGAGYLSLSGDIVLGDQRGDPAAIKTKIDYSGPALFIFTMGQHYWKSWLFGYQMGIMATSTSPYSFSQSFIALDIGYRVRF